MVDSPFLCLYIFSCLVAPFPVKKRAHLSGLIYFYKMNPLIVRLLAQVGTFR
ncbi:hypothetical protein EVA_16412 [gut metagenome]|uniref:Uncharacterized protein n=1 Tax=gut metagenome TaxID=749906 RepID=J9C6L4_9ZZZZ